jgi:hypothetical protein
MKVKAKGRENIWEISKKNKPPFWDLAERR